MSDPAESLEARLDAIDPTLDLKAEIRRLKAESNAVILCHYYQDSEIQDLGDALGDSLALARHAAKTDAEVIVFCGVHFMAETAKILNPDKLVLLPDLDAGCSLSECCPPDKFARFLSRYENPFVITYVNSSAAVKAMSDLICTSGNVLKMVEKAPKDRPIIFGPDRNLGRWAMEKTGREMVLWPGGCMVHEIFSLKELLRQKEAHPGAMVLAHPECPEHLLGHADFVGSTAAMLKKVTEETCEEFIVVTEPGILREMQRLAPKKHFYTVGNEAGCACNVCPHMRLNTLEKLYLCLRDKTPQIELPPDVCRRALVPLQRMLDWS